MKERKIRENGAKEVDGEKARRDRETEKSDE